MFSATLVTPNSRPLRQSASSISSRTCAALSLSPSYVNDAVRLLKLLLRQAVERDVIADYPIRKKVPKEKETPLRLELKLDERLRFYATFSDEEGFRRHLANR